MSKMITLDLNDDKNIEKIANALSAKVRRQIIKLSTEGSYSVMQIAEILNIPVSTISFHLKLLKEAGLINILPNPVKRGNEKVISQNISQINLDFRLFYKQKTEQETFDIPVGCYSNFEISPPCVLADSAGIMIGWDKPEAFYSLKRFNASLLAFTKGYVEYCVPLYSLQDKKVIGVAFSLELCSECPMHNNDWKSDITFWLNGVELCTYHSMGDYGERPGIYTPSFWPANATQYGMLKKVRVTDEGTFLDEERVSDVTIDDCNISNVLIRLKIGIKEDAKHVGGINLFGKGFGDTDQNISLQVAYVDKQS